ncbi:hypothetical protein FB45DRAFT_913819, partial [Roridomyces roridus]
PLNSSLDMYGAPDKSNAFSLSGHINIALASPYCLFERRRPARVHLQSILLTFHGQTEVITNSVGYTPLSLCSISRELAPPESLELSNEGQEDADEPCHWNVVFDIPVPGWLPATHGFASGDLGARTKYFLHAVARFLIIDEEDRTLFLVILHFLLPVPVSGQVCVLFEPPTDEPSSPGIINYLLNSPTVKSGDGAQIPSDILSKIQVLASVNVIQKEQCRRAVQASEYSERYPVPCQDLQPPNVPLLGAHRMADLYRMGIYCAPVRSATGIKCSVSLLPADEPGVYNLSGDTRIFEDDAVKRFRRGTRWRPPFLSSMMFPLAVAKNGKVPSTKCLTATRSRPAELEFDVPITMGRVAPPLPPRDILPALGFHSTRLPDGAYPPQPPLLPFGAANLPGTARLTARRLPLYTPKEESTSDSSSDAVLIDISTPTPPTEKQAELDAMTL